MTATEKSNGSTQALVKTEPGRLVRPIARPPEVLAAIQDTHAILRDTLTEGTDYGLIPGSARRVLLKPGAEKIAIAFGCRAVFDLVEAEVDHDRVFRFKSEWEEAPRPWPAKREADELKAAGKGRWRKVNDAFIWQVPGSGEEVAHGLYRYRYRCTLVRYDGQQLGEGEAVCSSLESKYRGRPHELENTVLKMAAKRAHVAAVLSAFGLSEAFTQDLDDEVEAAPHYRGERGSDDLVDPRDTQPTPARTAAVATAEAGQAKRLRGALVWAQAFVEQVREAGMVSPTADDDAIKAAQAAVKRLRTGNARACAGLEAIDQRIAVAVRSHCDVVEAALHDTAYDVNDAEQDAIDWFAEAVSKMV